MNYWVLIGILIIVIGFALKLDSLAVVLFAGIVTALIGAFNINDVLGSLTNGFDSALTTLGSAFVNNRLMSLFFLTLPVIGIGERYGLRERAMALIKGMKVATSGRILTFYQAIREVAGFFSLRLGGQPQFVRPLVEPMAQAAAEIDGDVDEALEDEIKGAAAASDNYGNFFAQNTFIASSGVLLIVGTLADLGYGEVTASQVALWSIPVAIIALLLAGVQFYLLDRKIKASGKGQE